MYANTTSEQQRNFQRVTQIGHLSQSSPWVPKRNIDSKKIHTSQGQSFDGHWVTARARACVQESENVSLHALHTLSGQQRSTLAGGKWQAAGKEIKECLVQQDQVGLCV